MGQRFSVFSSKSDTAAEEYLAKPSGACCLEGTIHQGVSRGKWETIADVETYIATPPAGKENGNVLLYFPDDPVWKHRKNRHDKTNPNFDYEAWKRKHTAFADEAVPKWVKAVSDRYNGDGVKFACVGYCFGAPYVCSELAKDTVSVGAFAHPAFLKEHHFENIKKPLFLSCSETDHTFDVPSRRRALDILEKGGKTYHYQLFSGVSHGFALRGDPSDPYQRWVKEQSLAGIVNWFDYWLAQ